MVSSRSQCPLSILAAMMVAMRRMAMALSSGALLASRCSESSCLGSHSCSAASVHAPPLLRTCRDATTSTMIHPRPLHPPLHWHAVAVLLGRTAPARRSVHSLTTGRPQVRRTNILISSLCSQSACQACAPVPPTAQRRPLAASRRTTAWATATHRRCCAPSARSGAPRLSAPSNACLTRSAQLLGGSCLLASFCSRSARGRSLLATTTQRALPFAFLWYVLE